MWGYTKVPIKWEHGFFSRRKTTGLEVNQVLTCNAGCILDCLSGKIYWVTDPSLGLLITRTACAMDVFYTSFYVTK